MPDSASAKSATAASHSTTNGAPRNSRALARIASAASTSASAPRPMGRDSSTSASNPSATISQSGANYVQDMGVPVFLSPLLGSNSAGDRASIFSAMMQMMAYGRSTLRMWMLASDEKMERSSASIGGFADLDDNGRATLVAVSGHPMTLLWGSEPGGLSTDDAGGRINWYATVEG